VIRTVVVSILLCATISGLGEVYAQVEHKKGLQSILGQFKGMYEDGYLDGELATLGYAAGMIRQDSIKKGCE